MIIFLLIIEFVFSPLERLATRIAVPSAQVAATIDTTINHIGGTYFVSKQDMQAEITELESQIDVYRQNEATLSLLRRENVELRKLLEFKEDIAAEQGIDLVYARILSRPPFTQYDSILIDVADTAVSQGDAVYANNFFIGTISEFNTEEKTALVSLVSNLAEWEAQLNGETITLVSQKGLSFTAKLPNVFEVDVDDVITLPDESLVPFAVIKEVQTSPSEAFLTIFAEVPLSLSQTDYVHIRR